MRDVVVHIGAQGADDGRTIRESIRIDHGSHRSLDGHLIVRDDTRGSIFRRLIVLAIEYVGDAEESDVLIHFAGLVDGAWPTMEIVNRPERIRGIGFTMVDRSKHTGQN